RSILRYLGTCDGDMEKGSVRGDLNVSVRKPGGPLGTRCEIKNMNSINFIGQAIEYEARRQIEIIEDGGQIDQETRLFDPNKGETRSMRSKEEAHDYRYFPDPDLLPLEFSQAFVDGLKAHLPELPDQKKARFIDGFGLSPYDAGALVEARGMKQVTDLSAIEKVVDEIIAANPDKVAQAKAKPQALGWFVGQVMKSSGGKANPQAVNDLLKSKLGI